ncbi:hypothetical protein [Microbispora rosea]
MMDHYAVARMTVRNAIRSCRLGDLSCPNTARRLRLAGAEQPGSGGFR